MNWLIYFFRKVDPCTNHPFEILSFLVIDQSSTRSQSNRDTASATTDQHQSTGTN